MKNYKFLFKPLFYIFSLLFSSWMVLKIEKLSPSDFGKYKSLFENESKSIPEKTKEKAPPKYDKTQFKKIVENYKAGLIDNEKLDEELEKFLDSLQKVSVDYKVK